MHGGLLLAARSRTFEAPSQAVLNVDASSRSTFVIGGQGRIVLKGFCSLRSRNPLVARDGIKPPLRLSLVRRFCVLEHIP